MSACRPEEIIKRVAAAPKKERTTVALDPEVLTEAAKMNQRSPAWILFVDSLRKEGVKVRDFARAVNGRRGELRVENMRRETEEHAAGGGDGRLDVLVQTEEFETNDNAAASLVSVPDLYQRGVALVDVIHDCKTNAPVIRELPAPIVRESLTRGARFLLEVKDKETGMMKRIPVHPPDWCVRAITDRGRWPGVRPLRAIVQVPTLRPDGTVLDEPGYDAGTGLLLEPSVHVAPVSADPSPEEVMQALDALYYVVKDVPFADAAEGWRIDESNWATRERLKKSACASAFLASILTPFARHCFSGPAPMFVYSANVRGTGKGLLTRVVSEILLGREMQFMTQTTERDAAAEDRKRITALAISGEPMVLIDNIRAPLGNGALEAAITSTTWGERVLGETSVPRVPLILTWYATGNNVLLMGDMPRRTVVVRLDSPYPKPEDRADYSEPNLIAYVQRERSMLVWAALTILRARCARGMNDLTNPGACGSFEDWSRVVRGAILGAAHAAGMSGSLADPWACRGSADDEDADDDAPSHAKLVDGWAEALRILGKDEAEAQEVLDALARDNESRARIRPPEPQPPVKFPKLREAMAELIAGLRPGDLPSARQFARHLRIHKDRSLPDGRRLGHRRTNEARLWGIRTRAIPTVAHQDEPDEREAIKSEGGWPERY